MQLAAESSRYYDSACQFAARLQRSRTSSGFDDGVKLYAAAYYLQAASGELPRPVEGKFSHNHQAYHLAINVGKKFFNHLEEHQ